MNVVCIDTEHSSGIYNPWEPNFYLTCVGVYGQKDGEEYEDIIWLDHKEEKRTDRGMGILQAYIDDADVVVMHNAKHDVVVLWGFGIRFDNAVIWCTQVADYLLEGQNKKYRYNLNAVADRYNLGQKHDEIKDMWDAGIQTYDIPSYLLGPYCIQDCKLTLEIYQRQAAKANPKLLKLIELHNEYTFALAEMEYTGLFVSKEQIEEIVQEYSEKANELRNKILKDVPHADKINLNSPQQLSALLYGGILKLSWLEWKVREYKTVPHSTYKETLCKEDVSFGGLGFTPAKKHLKDDGYYKVDKYTIESLNAKNQHLRNIKKWLVEYSRYAQVLKSLRSEDYKKGLWAHIQADGKIHPTFNQTVTANGRLSSSNPNAQNFPRGNTSPIKKIFVSALGKFVQVDLSQIEWRDAAWLSQDPVMIQEINDGVDQHIATVINLMELEFISKKDPKSKQNRDRAKVFNFRMIYGGSEWGFHLDINMPSFGLKKWRSIINQFFKKYSGLKKFHNTCVKQVYKHGYFKLPTGRWFKFHRVIQKDGSFDYSINQIKNLPISGMSGGDILPLMAVIINRGMKKMDLKSRLVLTVHDSLIADCPDDEVDRVVKLFYAVGNNLPKYLEAYYGLKWNVNLKCEVEVGKNLFDMEYIPEDSL